MSIAYEAQQRWTIAADAAVPAYSMFAIVGMALLWMFLAGAVETLFKSYKVTEPTVKDSLVMRLAKLKSFWFRLIFVVICCSFGAAHVTTTCRPMVKQVVIKSASVARTLGGSLDGKWNLLSSASLTFNTLILTGPRPNTYDYGWQLLKSDSMSSVASIASPVVALGTLANTSSFPVTVSFQQVDGLAIQEGSCARWHMIYWYGVVLIAFTAVSTNAREFFLGEGAGFMDYFNFVFRGRELPQVASLDDEDEGATRSYFGRKLRVGFGTLMPSTFITWIFAKSIFNSAQLGGRYGLLGGLGYASWYLSFPVAAISGYLLRTRYGYESLPEALHKTYGSIATLLFMFCCVYRLHNEIWSNATVVGQFYGTVGSAPYWGAAWFSCLVPCTYTMMGGMRGSLFTDVLQGYSSIVVLIIVLVAMSIDPNLNQSPATWSPQTPRTLDVGGEPGWEPGWILVAAGGTIQGAFSYTFFDPTLTDRAFLSDPKTMVASFLVGGAIAALFIFWFSMLGIYGAVYADRFIINCGCTSDCAQKGLVTAPGLLSADDCAWWAANQMRWGSYGDAGFVSVLLRRYMDPWIQILTIFIMVTASISTLDSTFTATGKMIALEFGGWLGLAGDNREHPGPLRPTDLKNIGASHLWLARGIIFIMLIVGVAFLGMETDAMSATTAAGSAVMGLGPPCWAMCFWRAAKGGSNKGWRQAPLAFILPLAVGWYFGLTYYNDGKLDSSVARTTHDKFRFTDDSKTYDCRTLPYTLCTSALATGCTWVAGNSSLGVLGSCTGGLISVQQHYDYSRFFGTNVVGHVACLGAFIVGMIIHQFIIPSFTDVVRIEERTKEVEKDEMEPESLKLTVVDETSAQEEVHAEIDGPAEAHEVIDKKTSALKEEVFLDSNSPASRLHVEAALSQPTTRISF